MKRRLVIITLLIPLAAACPFTVIAQNNTSDKAHPQPNSKHKDENPIKTPPSIAQVDTPCDDAHGADSEEDKETQRELADDTGLLAKLTGLLVAVGGLQAIALFGTVIIAIRQEKILHGAWDEIHTQAGHMSRQSDLMHRNNIVTMATARAAQKSAEVAAKSADAFIGSERAWLLVERDIPSGEAGLFCRFRVINCGRSPAEVTFFFGSDVLLRASEELPLIPLYEAGKECNCVPFWISPGKAAEEEVYLKDIGLLARSLPGQWDAISSGLCHFWIYGVVRYRDTISRAEHETRFCYRLSGIKPKDLVMGGPPDYNLVT
jgi:hypothetical protein